MVGWAGVLGFIALEAVYFRRPHNFLGLKTIIGVVVVPTIQACRRLLRLCVLATFLGYASAGWGFETFSVSDIRLEGLQRISAGTVFTYLPVKVGDPLTRQGSQDAVRALFKTGFFEDVRLERDGDVLVVFVRERPALAEINISGNDSMDTEDLLTGLRGIGFSVGRVFNQAILEQVEQELRRQYISQGKYSIRLDSEVVPLQRNRVKLNLKIAEGWVAKIRRINIVGNTTFDDEKLLDQFESGIPGSFSFFSSKDEYSRAKIAGDLEKLRSYYLDRGFLNFAVDSTQVSITPDKKDIYITVNVREGKKYNVGDVKVAGDLVIAEEIVRSLIKVKSGESFSRKLVTESAVAVTERLGDEGYAFANVNTIPEVNEEANEVKLTFFIDPGKRIFVRRISIAGNFKTHDEVIRRELRQYEGAALSGKSLKLSRERLNRLGFFQSVTVETPSVPGDDDKVDIVVKVVEKPSGNVLAAVGYSDTQGVIFSFSVNQENFLGTGSKVSLKFDNSDVSKTYSFSYNNPYYTQDGISRGFSVYRRETDAGSASVSDYTSDEIGASINYGIPVSEVDRLGVALEIKNTALDTTASTPTEIYDFINTYSDKFDTAKVTFSWHRDSRDRSFFATQGSSARATLELTGGDLEFYKLGYQHSWFYGLSNSMTLALKGVLGFGEGIGKTDALPFFENYYAGGIGSVRGFDGNSLGPKDSNGNPIGGNLKVVGGAEVIFVPPWLESSDSVRMGLFLDVGNVFDTVSGEYDASEFRASMGVVLNWFSPIGPLVFSFAEPIQEKAGDDIQQFQFTLGFAF